MTSVIVKSLAVVLPSSLCHVGLCCLPPSLFEVFFSSSHLLAGTAFPTPSFERCCLPPPSFDVVLFCSLLLGGAVVAFSCWVVLHFPFSSSWVVLHSPPPSPLLGGAVFSLWCCVLHPSLEWCCLSTPSFWVGLASRFPTSSGVYIFDTSVNNNIKDMFDIYCTFHIIHFVKIIDLT